jgi:hypothetical protein
MSESNKTSDWLLTAVSCGGLLAIGAAWLLTPAGANGAATNTVQQVTILADQVSSVVFSAEPSKPAKGTGNFAGVVTIDGAVPDQKLKFKKGDMTVKDAAVCSAADMPEESLVVDKESKGIVNVFLYLASAPAGKKFAPPQQPAVLDNVGCRFIPHGMVMQTGQTMAIKNADGIVHNSKGSPLRNTGFNPTIGILDRKGVPIELLKAERLPFKVECSLHNWMSAWVLPLDHPFGTVTNAKGEFEIKDLPPGKYEFLIWQESIGYVERKFAVEIAADKVTEKKIAVPAAKFAK